MFFRHFNLIVIYCPRTKNIKPDALSRRYEAAESFEPLDLILPAAPIAASVVMLLDHIVQVQQQEPDPAGGAHGRL